MTNAKRTSSPRAASLLASRLKQGSLALAFGFLITPALLSANVKYDSDCEPVAPTVDQARANILISRQLQFTHFRDQKIDDTLSGEVFDAYLEYLDGQKIYLTQQDINRFKSVRANLGSALKTGRLQPGFDIYNTVQQRIIERLDFALGLLDDGIDQFTFENDDQLTLDRSEAAWEENRGALDALWVKRIKNAVLAQRLNGSDNDTIEEALGWLAE